MKTQEVNDNALIQIHKSFLISPLTEGIYRDCYDRDRYFVTCLPKWLRIIQGNDKDVKLNMENNLSMLRSGLFLMKGPEDVIRIYDRNNNISRMENIRHLYLERMMVSPV